MTINELIDEENKILYFAYSSEYESIRVPREIAKNWLLKDKSIIRRGNVRYLQIKDIGLGICEVKLRKDSYKSTVCVTEFED